MPKLPDIWKTYEDDSEWPYILSKPRDDASFNPIDLDSLAINIGFWVVLFTIIIVSLTMLIAGLQFIGIVGP